MSFIRIGNKIINPDYVGYVNLAGNDGKVIVVLSILSNNLVNGAAHSPVKFEFVGEEAKLISEYFISQSNDLAKNKPDTHNTAPTDTTPLTEKERIIELANILDKFQKGEPTGLTPGQEAGLPGLIKILEKHGKQSDPD